MECICVHALCNQAFHKNVQTACAHEMRGKSSPQRSVSQRVRCVVYVVGQRVFVCIEFSLSLLHSYVSLHHHGHEPCHPVSVHLSVSGSPPILRQRPCAEQPVLTLVRQECRAGFLLGIQKSIVSALCPAPSRHR